MLENNQEKLQAVPKVAMSSYEPVMSLASLYTGSDLYDKPTALEAISIHIPANEQNIDDINAKNESASMLSSLLFDKHLFSEHLKQQTIADILNEPKWLQIAQQAYDFTSEEVEELEQFIFEDCLKEKLESPEINQITEKWFKIINNLDIAELDNKLLGAEQVFHQENDPRSSTMPLVDKLNYLAFVKEFLPRYVEGGLTEYNETLTEEMVETIQDMQDYAQGLVPKYFRIEDEVTQEEPDIEELARVLCGTVAEQDAEGNHSIYDDFYENLKSIYDYVVNDDSHDESVALSDNDASNDLEWDDTTDTVPQETSGLSDAYNRIMNLFNSVFDDDSKVNDTEPLTVDEVLTDTEAYENDESFNIDELLMQHFGDDVSISKPAEDKADTVFDSSPINTPSLSLSEDVLPTVTLTPELIL